MSEGKPIVGVIIGGTLAPGLNGLLAAVASYADQLHWDVIGFHDGYLHLATGNIDEVRANLIKLDSDLCGKVFQAGGSIVRPHRYDPSASPQELANTFTMLKALNIRYLLIIGGNDKMSVTHVITQGVDPAEMQVLCVPKTIDNDIDLGADHVTFGYESARVFASELVGNLMMDAKTAPRYFCVEIMGRKTGHMALSVAEGVGAHVCIIPEDFGDRKVTLGEICDIFEGAIIKRLAINKDYGVCIISEGLLNSLTEESLEDLVKRGFVNRTEAGFQLDDCELSRAVSSEINSRMKKRGLGVKVTPKKIGYELRSQPPNDIDAVYVRMLGYSAIKGFQLGHSNCLVKWNLDRATYSSFRSLMDPKTGKILPKRVDVESESYRITREFLSVIKERDLNDENKLAAMAAAVKMTPEQFLKEYGHIPRLTVK